MASRHISRPRHSGHLGRRREKSHTQQKVLVLASGSSISATPTKDICGIPIHALGPSDAAAAIVSAARDRLPLAIHLCNAYTLSLVDRDRRLSMALVNSDLNLPDGTPVAWLLRSSGVMAPARGPELVRDVVDRGQEWGLSHFFWGGGEGIAAGMAERLKREFPRLVIADTVAPPYRVPTDIDLREVAERATSQAADVIWVGLGTPKQDYVVAQLSELTSRPVVPVGAAFDIISGKVREAPRILRGSGLEWLFRLAMEPRRLWKRYLFGNFRFIFTYLRHLFAHHDV